jgi:hypothetical protein
MRNFAIVKIKTEKVLRPDCEGNKNPAPKGIYKVSTNDGVTRLLNPAMGEDFPIPYYVFAQHIKDDDIEIFSKASNSVPADVSPKGFTEEAFDFNFVMNKIDFLRAGKFKHLNDTALMSEIHAVIKGCNYMRVELEHPFLLLRGRRLEGNPPHKQISELVAPTPEKVKQYGRCNTPGNPIFYGTAQPTPRHVFLGAESVVTSEMGIKTGESIQFISCRLKEGKKLWCHIVGFSDYLRRHQDFPHFLKGLSIDKKNDIQRLHTKQIGKDLHDQNRHYLADAFFAEEFRKQVKDEETDEYRITALYSKIHIENNDAVIYPSVAHLGGWNIAIRPEVFNESFEIEDSYATRVLSDWGYGMRLPQLLGETSVPHQGLWHRIDVVNK